MFYRIMATRYGYAEIEADSEDEAMDIMEAMDEHEFNWEKIDVVEIVDEIFG